MRANGWLKWDVYSEEADWCTFCSTLNCYLNCRTAGGRSLCNMLYNKYFKVPHINTSFITMSYTANRSLKIYKIRPEIKIGDKIKRVFKQGSKKKTKTETN